MLLVVPSNVSRLAVLPFGYVMITCNAVSGFILSTGSMFGKCSKKFALDSRFSVDNKKLSCVCNEAACSLVGTMLKKALTTRVWNLLAEELKLETCGLLTFKSILFKYHMTSLITSYDVDDPRSYKTICFKV